MLSAAWTGIRAYVISESTSPPVSPSLEYRRNLLAVRFPFSTAKRLDTNDYDRLITNEQHSETHCSLELSSNICPAMTYLTRFSWNTRRAHRMTGLPLVLLSKCRK